ncbi:MAG: hypothetical protein Ct9H90mP9_4110 [Pseudomonadota bacterium]|nr:MAG: hypothetical protein Ct9H90mP9_4110 [Pseudomonadota bacterium]
MLRVMPTRVLKKRAFVNIALPFIFRPMWSTLPLPENAKSPPIESRTHGLLAVFADGRSYRVPLQTDLPAGQVFYCNYRSEPMPCASDQDWDTRCLKDRPYRPGLFRY